MNSRVCFSTSEKVISAAEALEVERRAAAKLPTDLDTAMFCCTGSEANELALRIARKVTDGAGIVVTSFSYHGNTQATYEVSTDSIADAYYNDKKEG